MALWVITVNSSWLSHDRGSFLEWAGTEGIPILGGLCAGLWPLSGTWMVRPLGTILRDWPLKTTEGTSSGLVASRGPA